MTPRSQPFCRHALGSFPRPEQKNAALVVLGVRRGQHPVWLLEIPIPRLFLLLVAGHLVPWWYW
jgi:hypothetical protein